MRRRRKRSISIMLVIMLCVSMLNVGNARTVYGKTTDVQVKRNIIQLGETQEDTASEYSIIFVDAEGKEVENSSTMNARQTFKLIPRLKDAEGQLVEDALFTYKSSDENVVTVSEEGLVTANVLKEQGTAQVTVTWTNTPVADETGTEQVQTVTAVYTVTVNAIIPVEGIQLQVSEKTLIVNENYTIVPTILPEGAMQDLVYTSSNEAVAKVDEKGVVVARSEGTAIITVASKYDATKTATMSVKVIDIPVAIELEKSTHSMNKNDSFEVKAYLVYSSGKKVAIDNSKLTFTSENEKIVTVDATGLVKAIEQASYPQIANINVSYKFVYEVDGKQIEKELKQSCQVTVVPVPVSGITLENKETEITLEIGETYRLLPVVAPSDAFNKEVAYESSDTSVAKVGKKGLITAKGIGDAVITVYSVENPEIKATFDVEVYQEVFDVVALGADGTDTKADTAVFKKVLKYADLIDAEITINVPAGTYYMNGMLTIYSNTNLVLDENAVIVRKPGATDEVMLRSHIDSKIGGYGQCENIKITGGTWDGNSEGDNDAACIYIGHANHVKITNTVIKNKNGSHLIEFAGVNNGLIENVDLSGYNWKSTYTSLQAEKEAIQLDYCSKASAPAMKPNDNTVSKNITIRNCKISNYMCGIGAHGSLPGVYLKNIVIENNTFVNITNTCIDLRNFKDVTIKGNTAKGFQSFLYATGSTGTVKKNTIINQSYKKATKNNLLAANGITLSESSEFKINNNVIKNCNRNGIYVENGSTATIKKNTIENCKKYGIRTKTAKSTLATNKFSNNKKGDYHTNSKATIKSVDDIRAYYVKVKSTYEYTGKKIKAKVTVNGLKKKNYQIVYKKNKKVGTAKVIMKGKGKYKGKITKTFRIVPKKER